MNNSALHVEVCGEGLPLVLLHGWGMHGGMFAPIVSRLQKRFRIYSIDLPGHGLAAHNQDINELDDLAHAVLSAVMAMENKKISILGWSMGGLVAQRMACELPQYLDKIILVASTASFVQREAWSFAMQPEVLRVFSEQLETDYAATLERFLALQFMGANEQKQNLRNAREILKLKPQPVLPALQQGMNLLINTDLKSELHRIRRPCLILGGERDKLVPTMALRLMAERMKRARCFIFKGASHAPFLTHSESFAEHVEAFLQ